MQLRARVHVDTCVHSMVMFGSVSAVAFRSLLAELLECKRLSVIEQQGIRRNLAIDGLRGICLVLMTMDHLPGNPMARFSNYRYGPFGFFTAASGFVVIISFANFSKSCGPIGM